MRVSELIFIKPIVTKIVGETMRHPTHYLIEPFEHAAVAVLEGFDRDVERGEDRLMLGLGIVLLSSTFAPIAPPYVLLPLVALTFAISASVARCNYHAMQRKLNASLSQLERYEQGLFSPLTSVFNDYPMPPLSDSFNLLKNGKRTLNCLLAGVLINPFWMPICYFMLMQIREEKNLILLNQAVIEVERRLEKYILDAQIVKEHLK